MITAARYWGPLTGMLLLSIGTFMYQTRQEAKAPLLRQSNGSLARMPLAEGQRFHLFLAMFS